MVLNYVSADPANLRADYKFPDHIGFAEIETAARAYWRSVSDVAWATLSDRDRQWTMEYIKDHVTVAWALKEAGIG